LHPTVLIVDDTELLRFLMRELLDELPLGLVAGAGTPEEAIRLAQTLGPELIVVDWTGPVAAGELLAVLRRITPVARLAAAVLHADERSAAAARRAGAEIVLWKPYSRAETLAVLAEALTPRSPAVC